MDHIDLYLFGGELDEGIGKGLHGTVHITLDDNVEFLEVTDGYAASYLLESHVLLGLDALDAQELLTLVGDALGFLLVSHHIELLARRRSAVETEHRDRRGRTGLRHLLPTLVEHGLDPSVIASAEHHIPLTESAFLHEYRSEVAAALVK